MFREELILSQSFVKRYVACFCSYQSLNLAILVFLNYKQKQGTKYNIGWSKVNFF